MHLFYRITCANASIQMIMINCIKRFLSIHEKYSYHVLEAVLSTVILFFLEQVAAKENSIEAT